MRSPSFTSPPGRRTVTFPRSHGIRTKMNQVNRSSGLRRSWHYPSLPVLAKRALETLNPLDCHRKPSQRRARSSRQDRPCGRRLRSRAQQRSSAFFWGTPRSAEVADMPSPGAFGSCRASLQTLLASLGSSGLSTHRKEHHGNFSF